MSNSQLIWDLYFQVMYPTALQHRFLLNIYLGEKNLYVFMQRSWVADKALCSIRPIFFPSGSSFSTEGAPYSSTCNIASLGHFQPPWTPLPFRTASKRTLSTLSNQCLSRSPRWPFCWGPSRVFLELKIPISQLLSQRCPASTPLLTRSSGTSPLLGFPRSCVRKLPATHRNLLDCLLAAVLYLHLVVKVQETFGKLNPLWEPGLAMIFVPAAYRIFCGPLHSD